MNTPVLPAGSVRLRPVEVADADGPYLDWLQDPEILRYLEARFSSHTRASLAAYIEACRDDPRIHFWAIELEDDGRHVGNIKLGPVDEPHRRADIGIMIGDRRAWGRGIGTAAITAVADFAFGELRLHKLVAGSYAPNEGSVRAFGRAGFHVEGRLERHWYTEGAWVDGVLLARFAPDVGG